MKKELRSFWSHVKRIFNKLGDDNLSGYGAMLAFYMLFSLLAFFLLLVFVAGTLLHNQGVVTETLNELDRIFPGIPRSDMADTIKSLRSSSGSVGIIAFVGLLWTGSSLWSAIDSAMSKIFSVPRRSFLKKRLHGTAITVVLVLFFFVVFTLIGLTGISASGVKDLPFGISRIPNILTYLSLFITWLISVGMCGFIYRFGPDVPITWRDVWPGVLFGSILITALTLLFPAYLALVDVTRYGAAFGFLVLTLSWMFLVSFAILLGAEICSLRYQANASKDR